MTHKDLNKKFEEFKKKKKEKPGHSDLDKKFHEKKSKKHGIFGKLFKKKDKKITDKSKHHKRLSELENELHRIKSKKKKSGISRLFKQKDYDKEHHEVKEEKTSGISKLFKKKDHDKEHHEVKKEEKTHETEAPLKEDAPKVSLTTFRKESLPASKLEEPESGKDIEEYHKEVDIKGEQKQISEKEKEDIKAVSSQHFKKASKKDAPTEVKEKDIRKLFRAKIKEKKKKLTAAERKRKLSLYLEKSGLDIEQQTLAKYIFYVATALTVVLTIIYIFLDVRAGSSIAGIFGHVIIVWILGILLLWGFVWIIFRIYLDLLMFRRKLSVEEVLPDFLQLTSANLRAGMPIDRALWFAVRPRFGVLANEIEDVAKRTLAGEPLSQALLGFAKRYDSQVLLRSVYLLNEGMEAGGDVGDLLNKIAINITDMRRMRKEMAANVMTYVIFISFASMIAAPALFSLSSELLSIVQSIAGNVAGSTGTQGSGFGLTINISDETIKLSHYKIFAYLCLTITSGFSAIIVATIKKGNVKEGLEYIPIFIIVTLIVFFIGTKLMGLIFGGMF